MKKLLISYFNLTMIVLFLSLATLLQPCTGHAQEQSQIQVPSEYIIAPPPDFQLAEPRTFRYGDDDSLVHIQGALIAPLRLNQQAPFAGVLLNNEANAWLIAEFNAVQEYWINEMNRRVDQMRLWAFAEIAGYRSRLQEESDAVRVQLNNCTDERTALEHTISELQTQYSRERRRLRVRQAFTVIGAVIGAGASGYVIGRVVP